MLQDSCQLINPLFYKELGNLKYIIEIKNGSFRPKLKQGGYFCIKLTLYGKMIQYQCQNETEI